MRKVLIIAVLEFLLICVSQVMFGQLVLKVVPTPLENVVNHNKCEFRITNKHDMALDILLHLHVDYDTTRCILSQQSDTIRIKAKQSIIANWDTLCNGERTKYPAAMKLEYGMYTISLIAEDKQAIKILGRDCLQIYYSE